MSVQQQITDVHLRQPVSMTKAHTTVSVAPDTDCCQIAVLVQVVILDTGVQTVLTTATVQMTRVM